LRILPAGDGVRLVRDVRIPMRDGVLITIDLAIAIDGSELRTRSWDERIPRNLL